MLATTVFFWGLPIAMCSLVACSPDEYKTLPIGRANLGSLHLRYMFSHQPVVF